MKPIEEVLPREERERLRREALGKTPRWYVPWMHVAMPGLFGLGVAALALSRLHDVRSWQLGFFVFVLLLSNATESRVHGDLLHQRFRPRLMQKWNFNVTVPLWDFVRGTKINSRSASSTRAAS